MDTRIWPLPRRTSFHILSGDKGLDDVLVVSRRQRVTDSSLQDDLLAIAGVEGAEVEGSADKPAGLRIRIAEGADQHAVGGAIRRVLTAHGLGTDTRLPGEGAASAPIAVVPSEAPTDDGSDDDAQEGDQAASRVAVADGEVIDLTDDAPDDVGDEPAPDDDAHVTDIVDLPADDLDDEPVVDDLWEDAPEPLEDTRVVPAPTDISRDGAAHSGGGGICPTMGKSPEYEPETQWLDEVAEALAAWKYPQESNKFMQPRNSEDTSIHAR